MILNETIRSIFYREGGLCCMWFILALASAVFAALTSILAKVGIDGVNSNLATAIRTLVVLFMAWGMVFLTNAQDGLQDISRRSWINHRITEPCPSKESVPIFVL
jgi:hypothetical protein